jgi:GNAT superfamily N-acetyltransferase
MLMYAAHESSLEAVWNQPALSRYAINWGQIGDLGFVALVNRDPLGAAWVRLWSGEDKGFGYVNDPTPELAIAVSPICQGKGVGSRLLARLLEAIQDDYNAVSLSVRADNPAVRLYERAGFVKVEGSEVVNRTGGGSFSMICQFGSSPLA